MGCGWQHACKTVTHSFTYSLSLCCCSMLDLSEYTIPSSGGASTVAIENSTFSSNQVYYGNGGALAGMHVPDMHRPGIQMIVIECMSI